MGDTGEGDPLFQSAPPKYSPQQRQDVQDYIANHESLRQFIVDLMREICTQKPEDPIAFAAEYVVKEG